MNQVTLIHDEDEIAHRVGQLAVSIAASMPDGFLMVVLLKGGFVFAADLVRALDGLGRRLRVEFLRLGSYRDGKESAGAVELIGGVPDEIDGQVVLLVDDILDTGRTLERARELVEAAGAAGVKTCALVDKPSRREIEINADFVGFEVDDVFVVGYGIDYAEAYRHLPYLGKVD